MKYAYAIIAVTLLALPANAAGKPDKQFDAFYTKFKTALAKNDRNLVADLTKLPFLYDSKQLDKKQFIAKLNTIIPKADVARLQKEKAIVDNGVTEVFCDEAIYCFEKVKGEYKFTEIGVND
jgi:hypothetical protein